MLNRAKIPCDRALLPVDKHRIADNFSKAADYYDHADHLQRRVAGRLMLCTPEHACSVIDLGCGTGKWTRALAKRYANAQVMGLDFATGMLQKAYLNRDELASSALHWIAGDIEALPLRAESVDLAFSSLAIQWCQNLSSVIEEVSRILKPGGSFVLSTLAQGSLFEMRSLWQNIDNVAHANDHPLVTDIEAICGNSSLSLHHFHCSHETLYCDTVMTLLRGFKLIGANTVVRAGSKGLTASSKMQAFIKSYEQLRQAQGIPCTYEVVYIVLRKA